MNKIENSFFKRIKFKYKLSILNENTLEEAWRIRLSRLNVFLASFFVAVVYFFLIAFLIIKTPLRSFLPGYTDNMNLRNQVILDAIQVDSIMGVVKQQQQYITVLQDVIAGNIKVDPNATMESLVAKDYSKVDLNKTENENKFREEFEQGEKNTPASNNRQQDMDYLMHYPAKGVVDKKFNEKTGFWGTSIKMTPNSNIYSILDGVAIFSGFSANDNLFVMQIQHSDNLVSIYKTNQPFLAKVGSTIRAGEILTSLKKEPNPELIFELWKKGKPLNPETYITF